MTVLSNNKKLCLNLIFSLYIILIMSCINDPNDSDILICGENPESANYFDRVTYIKNISKYPNSVAFAPAYKTLPNNCVLNQRKNVATCVEYTDPALTNLNSKLSSHYVSRLTKIGDYYVQDVPRDILHYNLTYKNPNKNLPNAPICIINTNKCSKLENNCESLCIGKDGTNYPSVYKGPTRNKVKSPPSSTNNPSSTNTSFTLITPS